LKQTLAKKKTAQKAGHASSKPGGALSVPSDYPQLLSALKSRIQTARVRAHLAVNQERTLLYWDIGQMIQRRQDLEGWGKQVIPRLAKDLAAAFPDLPGFSARNLGYMIRFSAEYPSDPILQHAVAKLADAGDSANLQGALAELGDEFLQQSVAKSDRQEVPQPVAKLQPTLLQLIVQLPWGHNITLIEKVKDLAIRKFYAAKTIENGWSRAVLVHQIESELHLRANSQSNNFALTLPDPQSDLARELIKDSFNLEFLDIRESIRERELEESLIANLRDFLLELGTGFAFIGNQYRLEIGGQDYFLDLLFYHTRLHCHIVVELKIEAFKPEHAGKMQFYLAAVDDLLKSDRDAPTIGILLCKEKNKVVVEFALRDASKPIAVADYTLQKTLPKELRDELPSAAELKKQLKGGEKR